MHCLKHFGFNAQKNTQLAKINSPNIGLEENLRCVIPTYTTCDIILMRMCENQHFFEVYLLMIASIKTNSINE